MICTWYSFFYIYMTYISHINNGRYFEYLTDIWLIFTVFERIWYVFDICSVVVRTSTVLSAIYWWASATLTPPFSTNACAFLYFWLFLAIYIIFLILFTVSSHIYEYIWRIKTSVFQIWEHNFPMPVQISFPIMLFLRTVIGKVIHRPERKTVLTRFFFLSHQCRVIL